MGTPQRPSDAQPFVLKNTQPIGVPTDGVCPPLRPGPSRSEGVFPFRYLASDSKRETLSLSRPKSEVHR